MVTVLLFNFLTVSLSLSDRDLCPTVPSCLCHCSTVPQFYIIVPLFHCTILSVPLFYYASISLCHFFTVPQFHCATVPLRHHLCASVPLCHPLCATVLLCLSSVVRLFNCGPVPLCHCPATAPLYPPPMCSIPLCGCLTLRLVHWVSVRPCNTSTVPVQLLPLCHWASPPLCLCSTVAVSLCYCASVPQCSTGYLAQLFHSATVALFWIISGGRVMGRGDSLWYPNGIKIVCLE